MAQGLGELKEKTKTQKSFKPRQRWSYQNWIIQKIRNSLFP